MVNYSYLYHLDNKCGQMSTPDSRVDLSGPEGGKQAGPICWAQSARVEMCCFVIIILETEMWGDKSEGKEHQWLSNQMMAINVAVYELEADFSSSSINSVRVHPWFDECLIQVDLYTYSALSPPASASDYPSI